MRALAVSLSLLSLTLPATAQDEDYYYAGFHFGLSDSLDEDLRGLGQSTLDIETDKKLGAVGGLYIGRNINKWRYEFEYALRNNSISSLDVTGSGALGLNPGNSDASGSQQADSFMANAHYNFANIDDWKAYAGIGLGMSLLQLDDLGAQDVTIASSRNWEPSGQAMVHVAKALGGVELGFGFRHFRTLTGRFGTETGVGRYRFVNNEVFARVSWKFGEKSRPAPRAAAPAPQPVAAPAPAPAPKPAPKPEPKPAPIPGPFMVFFDFDKTAITADAQAIIERAARVYREQGLARINANGHADRSGSDAYNEALAMRRAQAVRDALIAEGVPAGRITIRSLGETSPLVSTDDGVREWQNRRVEIVLSK